MSPNMFDDLPFIMGLWLALAFVGGVLLGWLFA